MPFGEAGGMTCTTRSGLSMMVPPLPSRPARGERDRHVDLSIMHASSVIIYGTLPL
jgi:hypothetical protein